MTKREKNLNEPKQEASQPVKLPDFKTYQERDEFFKANANYFTIIKKGGLGYQRDERKTLAEAEALAQTKKTISGGNYLIYAVIGEQSAFVKSVS